MPKVPEIDFDTVPSLSVTPEPTPKVDYGGEAISKMGNFLTERDAEITRRVEQTDAINSSMLMDEYFNSTVSKSYTKLMQKVKANPNMSDSMIEAEFNDSIVSPLQKERARLSSLTSNPELSSLEINKSIATKAGRLQSKLQSDVMKIKVDSARDTVKLSIESNTAGAKTGSIDVTDLAVFRDRLYGRLDEQSGQLMGGISDSIGVKEAREFELDNFTKVANGRISYIDQDSSPASIKAVEDIISYGRSIKVPDEITSLMKQKLDDAIEGARENDYNDLKSSYTRLEQEFHKGPARQAIIGELFKVNERLNKSSFIPSQAEEIHNLKMRAENAFKLSASKASEALSNKIAPRVTPKSRPVSRVPNAVRTIEETAELAAPEILMREGAVNIKNIQEGKSTPFFWDNKGGTSATGVLHTVNEVVKDSDKQAVRELYAKIEKRAAAFKAKSKANYTLHHYLKDEYGERYGKVSPEKRPSLNQFIQDETGLSQNSKGQWVGEPKGVYAAEIHAQKRTDIVYSLGSMWLNGLSADDEMSVFETNVSDRAEEMASFFKKQGDLDINSIPPELSTAMLSTWYQYPGFFKNSKVSNGSFGIHLDDGWVDKNGKFHSYGEKRNKYNQQFHKAVAEGKKTGNWNPLTKVFMDAVKDFMGSGEPNDYQKRRLEEFQKAIKAENNPTTSFSDSSYRSVAGINSLEDNVQSTFNSLSQHPDFAEFASVEKVRADYRRQEKELQNRYNNNLVDTLNGADPSIKPQLESGDPAVINKAKKKILGAAINLNLDSSSIKFLTRAQVKQQASLIDSYAKGGDPEGGRFYSDIMAHYNNLGGYFGDNADAAVGVRQLINEGKSGEGRTVPYLTYMLPLVDGEVGALIAAGYNNRNKLPPKEQGELNLEMIVANKYNRKFFADDSYTPRSESTLNGDIAKGFVGAVTSYAAALIDGGRDEDSAISEAQRVVERETGLVKGAKIDLFGGSPSVEDSLMSKYGKEVLQKTADNIDEAFAFAMMEPATLSQLLEDIPSNSDMARNIKNVMDIAKVDKVEAAKAFMTTLSSDLIFDLDPDRLGNFTVYVRATEGKPKQMMFGNTPASFPIEDAVRYTMNPKQEQYGPATPLKGPSSQEVSRRLGSRIFFGGF